MRSAVFTVEFKGCQMSAFVAEDFFKKGGVHLFELCSQIDMTTLYVASAQRAMESGTERGCYVLLEDCNPP